MFPPAPLLFCAAGETNLSSYSGPVAQYQTYSVESAEISERVSGHRQEVGPLTRLERPQLVFEAEQLRCGGRAEG